MDGFHLKVVGKPAYGTSDTDFRAFLGEMKFLSQPGNREPVLLHHLPQQALVS